MLQRLPPAEDADERAMDEKLIHYSLDLTPADYGRLCDVQHLRRRRGDRVSLRQLILDAIYGCYPLQQD